MDASITLRVKPRAYVVRILGVRVWVVVGIVDTGIGADLCGAYRDWQTQRVERLSK